MGAYGFMRAQTAASRPILQPPALQTKAYSPKPTAQSLNPEPRQASAHCNHRRYRPRVMPAGMLSRTSALQRTVTHAHRMTPALHAALHASLHASVISSLYYTLPVAQALSLSSAEIFLLAPHSPQPLPPPKSQRTIRDDLAGAQNALTTHPCGWMAPGRGPP